MNVFARGFLLTFAALGIQIASARGTATLVVDDPRPVAKAVEMLVSQYGYAVTYEDPRYEYGGDLQDVTDQVRKDLAKYPPRQAPRVLIPRGDRLTLNMPSTTTPQDVQSTLESLVHMNRHTGGHFRVLEAGGAFHVIPTQVRDVHGNWRATTSILNERISIPTQERTEDAFLNEICKAVSSAVNTPVWVGGFARGLRISPEARYRFGANNEVARDVLMRALATTGETKRTWLLLYDASERAYALNIRGVPDWSTQLPASPAVVPQLPVAGPSLPPCTATSTDPRQCQSVSK